MAVQRVSSLVAEKHSLLCLLPELLVDQSKISVSNVQSHVINVKNQCPTWSGVCWYSESWNIEANPEAELAMSVCDAARLRNWTKMSSWRVWKKQTNQSKGTTDSWFVIQCFGFAIYMSIFGMENFTLKIISSHTASNHTSSISLVQWTATASVLDEGIWF